jgi:hypothetical protein
MLDFAYYTRGNTTCTESTCFFILVNTTSLIIVLVLPTHRSALALVCSDPFNSWMTKKILSEENKMYGTDLQAIHWHQRHLWLKKTWGMSISSMLSRGQASFQWQTAPRFCSWSRQTQGCIVTNIEQPHNALLLKLIQQIHYKVGGVWDSLGTYLQVGTHIRYVIRLWPIIPQRGILSNDAHKVWSGVLSVPPNKGVKIQMLMHLILWSKHDIIFNVPKSLAWLISFPPCKNI